MTAETTHPAPLPPTKAEADLPAIFRKAAEVLRANGHHQGDYYNHLQSAYQGLPPKACAVCTYGALNIAAGGDPEHINGMARLAAMALADHLGIPDTPAAIGVWNDRAGRTAEQVETVFREIAAELERTA